MASDPIDKIIELAIADPEFRKQLLDNPTTALLQRGIQLEADQIKLLESIANEDVGVMSNEISERLAKVSEVERSY